jgi:hypothetical protein
VRLVRDRSRFRVVRAGKPELLRGVSAWRRRISCIGHCAGRHDRRGASGLTSGLTSADQELQQKVTPSEAFAGNEQSAGRYIVTSIVRVCALERALGSWSRETSKSLLESSGSPRAT